MKVRFSFLIVSSLLLVLVVLLLPHSLTAQTEPVDCEQFYEAAVASTDGRFCIMSAPELDFINIIEVDNRGRIWIGTDGRGLTLIENGTLRNWQPETSDIREDAIRGMAVNDEYVVAGLFGCGGCGGVAIYDIAQDQWTNLFPEDSELSGGGVGGVTIDQNNRVYMPTGNGDLDVWENKTWQHMAANYEDDGAFQIIGNSNDAIFDSNGVLYVGYDGGLKKFDGSTWEEVLSFPNQLNVEDLVIDRHGYIWAATGNGIFVGNEAEGWKAAPLPPLPTASTPEPYWGSFDDIAIDPEGRIWVVSIRFLGAFNGQEWEIVSKDPQDTFWGEALAFDNDGNLWLEKDQALAVFTDEIGLLPPTYQSLADIAGFTPPIQEGPAFGTQRPPIPTWFLAIGLIFICGGLLFIGIIVLYLVRTRSKPTLNG